MKELGDIDRIGHMVERIRRIQASLQGVSDEQFYQSSLLIDGVTYNFAIIGEAANNVSIAMRNKYLDIPWRTIVAMRNFLIHEYIKIEPRLLWETAQNDLPPLLRQLENIIGES